MNELIWIKGQPSPEEVSAHEIAHPYIDDRKQKHGGIWLMIDEQSHFGPYPQLIRLRVGKDQEEIAEPYLEANHGVATVNVSGKLLMENGFSFWQLLERCRWADRAIYTPVSALGIPIRWKI